MIQMHVPCRAQLELHASVAICERERARERESESPPLGLQNDRTSPHGLLNKPELAHPSVPQPSKLKHSAARPWQHMRTQERRRRS